MDVRGVLLALDDPVVDFGLPAATSSSIAVELLEGDLDGVNFESGRKLPLSDAVSVRLDGDGVEAIEEVEYVLRATERTEEAEEDVMGSR